MRYLRNIAVALSWLGFGVSCLVNALRGGDGNETLCGALHRAGWASRLPRLIRNHCQRSFERGL